jgi:hypothetical protein
VITHFPELNAANALSGSCPACQDVGHALSGTYRMLRLRTLRTVARGEFNDRQYYSVHQLIFCHDLYVACWPPGQTQMVPFAVVIQVVERLYLAKRIQRFGRMTPVLVSNLGKLLTSTGRSLIAV